MTTAPIRSDWVGRVIDGRFTLHQWLGGSEGSGVFRTDLQGDGSRKAALKLVPADAQDSKAWFAGSPSSHPYLIRLIHTGRCEIDTVPLLYQVMDYAEENLAEILPERPLTPAETKEMLDPVLDALSYLHGKGFVHGHLKPSNILVVDNQVKLSWDKLYVTGMAGKHLPMNSVYDAPDSAGEAISPAADIWSLGVTIVEALTQRTPVWDGSPQNEPVVPQSIPQPFFGIAQDSLRLDPARRCTLSDIRSRLNPAAAQPVQTEKARDPRSSKRLVVALIIIAALVAVAVVAAVLARSRGIRRELHEDQNEVRHEAQQPASTIAKPSPKSPASKTKTAPSEVVATKGEVGNGAVAKQVLPDVLPEATASIHGQFNLSIRLNVDSAGNVSDAEFDSPGPSKYFAKVAMQAAQRWKFKAPQVGGEAVPSEWLLQFKFTPAGTEITPVQISP
jgi:TonB family protein